MEVTLNIKPDAATVNGRIYPRDLLIAAIEEKIDSPLFITKNPTHDGTVALGEVLGQIESYKIDDEDNVIFECKFINEPDKDKPFKLSLAGYGRMNNNKTMIIFSIIHAFMVFDADEEESPEHHDMNANITM